jgi:phosphohistidine phosphatase
MTRQLLILRHAKSDWHSGIETDFERPLNKRGEQDAPRIGQWMQEHGIQPDYILSSPAERAKQTVLKVIRELGIAKDDIHWQPRIYEAGPNTLLELLGDCPDTAQTVLLVGHNPGLEYLLLHLCGREAVNSPDGKILPTATLARLEMPDGPWHWPEPGSARLLSITRPRSLS